MSTDVSYSKKPVICAGIITGLYAFSPLIFFFLHSEATIPVMSSGIFGIPNGLYCLMLFSSRVAAVSALIFLWLLLWGFAYLIVRLVRRLRSGKGIQ